MNVLVGVDGEVEDVRILRDLGEGNNGCAEAAIAAVRAVKWQSARYEDKPVAVWVGIPIIFRLNGGSKSKPNDQGANIALKTDSETGMVYRVPTLGKSQEFDELPQPVGGFKSVQQNLKYPELARKAGIEGEIVIQVFFGADGKIKNTKILKDIGAGNDGCAEAAVAAIKETEWIPAKKNGKSVETWVGIPVIFKLK